MNKLFTINQVNYEIDNKKILENLNCEIEEGITIINGPNGAGKTTFIKLLFGFMQPTSGNITRHFNIKKKNISFVFQEPIFLNRSVEENLEHVLYCKSFDKRSWKNIIIKSLDEYGLSHLLKSHIKSLSGGELQMLSLIRSTIIDPGILFYDEPTNNLDESNIMLVKQIVTDYCNKGASIILVSHDDIIDDKKYKNISMNLGSINDA